MDPFWDILKKIPELLEQYGNYSWALLAVILGIGALLLLYARTREKDGRPKLVATGLLLAAAAIGGGVLKASASVARERESDAWVASHRAREGERRIVVAKFLPIAPGEAANDGHAPRALVTTLTSVLGEDLPESIPAPLVVLVDFGEPVSPWRAGVGQDNFQEILSRLSALEILWGDLDVGRRVVRAFIGFPLDLSPLDPVVPLNELPVAADPRRDVRFGAAYHRVLGHVALGVAFDTMRDAQQAGGDERRRLFLLAARQLTEAQALVAGYRDDPVLKKTLYGSRTKELLDRCNAEAGVTP